MIFKNDRICNFFLSFYHSQKIPIEDNVKGSINGLEDTPTSESRDYKRWSIMVNSKEGASSKPTFSRSRPQNLPTDIPALDAENQLLRKQIQELETFLVDSELAMSFQRNAAALDDLNLENAALRDELAKISASKRDDGHYFIDQEEEEVSMRTLNEVSAMIKSESVSLLNLPELSSLKDSHRLAVCAALTVTSSWAHKNFRTRSLKSIDTTVSNLNALEKALKILDGDSADYASVDGSIESNSNSMYNGAPRQQGKTAGAKKPLFRHRMSVLTKA